MNIKDELHVSIHIELGSDIKLAEAEEITKRIEDEIKKYLLILIKFIYI